MSDVDSPHWFVAFWTRPLRPEPLALFRILLGSVILVSLLEFSFSLDRYLGPDGLCPVEGVERWLRDKGRFSLLVGLTNVPVVDHLVTPAARQAWAAWGERFGAVELLFALWVGSVLCLTIGLGTRVATVAAWALTMTFHNRLSWLLNGGDYLFRTGLFYLMLAPAGTAWSLDNVIWRRPRRLIPAWPVRLVQIQLCLLYLAAGVTKLNEDWLRGEAVYWVLNDLALARWSYCQVPVPMFLCQLLSWGTLLFELGFSVLVLFPRVRHWLLLAGLALHGGIWLTTEIGWFSPVILCWYSLFLWPEQETPQAAGPSNVPSDP
jgi:hypothetical protein